MKATHFQATFTTPYADLRYPFLAFMIYPGLNNFRPYVSFKFPSAIFLFDFYVQRAFEF